MCLPMDGEAGACSLLEHMLLDESSEPTDLPLSLLKSITNNFSDDQLIGSGGFATVYKGILQNGTIAVKKLSQVVDIDENNFKKEVSSLIRVRHKNIVRFLGYCADTQGKVEKYQGKVVMADVRQRLLCFEFLPNGSLDGYITDASQGLEWRTRYQIIKGICEGVHHLHQKKIVHLDLKPANILLNYNMVPKIADFGLSRCFDEKQSRTITSNLVGSLGYLAPEFFSGVITFKIDIYSLGVIVIEILTGQKGYIAMENVLDTWSNRFDKPQGDAQMEQIRVCAEIGLVCIDSNPEKRPTTQHIVDTLNEMESRYGFVETDRNTSSSCVSRLMDMCAAPSPLQRVITVRRGPGQTNGTEMCSLWSSGISKLLDVHPLEISLPLESNKLIECPVSLTNRTDHYVGVWITPIWPDTLLHFAVYWGKSLEGPACLPLVQTLEPHSTFVVAMTIKEQAQEPSREAGNKFEVAMIVMGSLEDLDNLKFSTGIELKLDVGFVKRVEELGGEVHRAVLTAAVVPDEPAAATCQLPGAIHDQKFIPAVSEFGDVWCTDTHPTETWMLMGYEKGYVSICNYDTQERVMELQVSTHSAVCSATFIAGEQWLAVGCADTWVRVYAYTTKEKVWEFAPHRRKTVTALAVHPTEPLLLTASNGDDSIKLWDWSQGWVCARAFHGGHGGVRYLSFDPRDADTFASASGRYHDGDGIRVWSIHSSDPVAALPEEWSESACFFYTDGSRRHLLVNCPSLMSGDSGATIWDLQTKERVHKLMTDRAIRDVACHPTLPILATATSEDEEYRNYHLELWDGQTYRLEKMVQLMDDLIGGMIFTSTKNLARLIVPCTKGISVVELNFPTLKVGLH